ncbi:MAG: glycine cleavage system aminomethyltransferase GcvT [Planctomycetota bacterium]|nr:glycine cleavage system aminomethyltransferase GcvT [Planctomycetota bacterium]
MTSVDQLLKTPFHQWHTEHHGRMVDFAGWSMPVQYKSIMEEHHQTRKAVGLFDVSHMGRLFFKGTGIDQFLDSLTTRRVAGVEVGRIRYSLMTNDQGGILDDVLVYHLADSTGQPFHMMVVNASNRDKIVHWLKGHIPNDSDITVEDRTLTTAMIAVQGPKANAMVGELCSVAPADLKYYTGTAATISEHPVILSRTGYTGEDGCELIVESEVALAVWETLMQNAITLGGGATGLAARDTLRLEAAMPLYGHELNEETNAAQTDLKFAINLKDREFIGREAIVAANKDQDLPIRIGLELQGKRAAREDCAIIAEGNQVGTVTSGTFAPTLQKSISMGYIDRSFADPGTELEIDIRGKRTAAQVVKLPFYTRD